jgi:excinuclease ABC subunit A
VLFSRTGERYCPTHALPTAEQSVDVIISRLLIDRNGEMITIAIPVANAKKGSFQTRLNQLAQKGFVRGMVNGKWTNLQPAPSLGKDDKHDISVAVDQLKIGEGKEKRLERSLHLALNEGGGVVEIWSTAADGKPQGKPQVVSTHSGCPECGYSWPALDARFFSANSVGRCTHCTGKGLQLQDNEETTDDIDPRLRYYLLPPCSSCQGTGIKSEMSGVRLNDQSVIDLQNMAIGKLGSFISQYVESRQDHEVVRRVGAEIAAIIERLKNVGLSHLQLARKLGSLSGGEMQRLRLAGVVGESLRGVLYVLDEPSQGLHYREVNQLAKQLQKLVAQGNTVVAVDHDLGLLAAADWIVDLGPGGGSAGGEVVAEFAPASAAKFSAVSATAQAMVSFDRGFNWGDGMAKALRAPTCDAEVTSKLRVIRPHLNNLRCQEIEFLRGRFNVVAGETGAGKSSLIYGIIYANLVTGSDWRKIHQAVHCEKLEGWDSISKVVLVDRRSLARSSVSMPATYLDVFSDLRQIYCKVPEAQMIGLTPRDFSLSVNGGRCPECSGRGEIRISMKFLADAFQRCPICHGHRYQVHLLGVRYHGLNISEVLELSIADALEQFRNHRKIATKLRCAVDLGLGYLRLGQATSSLSGGEAQRLKLANMMASGSLSESLMILDEPTRGLHAEDITRLITCLKSIVASGATIVVVEHSLEVIQSCDWLVELGSLTSDQRGGEILFTGPVAKITISEKSLISRASRHEG